MVPNHPRYQLRYTRSSNFEVFLSVVIPVVKADFRSGPALWPNPANAHVPRLSGLCVLLPRIDGATLPNHPRYQLRYTRKLNFEVFLSVVIPVVKAGLRSGPAFRTSPANARAARLSGLCLFLARIDGAALPNHPRYQLRHARLFDVISIAAPSI